MYSVINVHDYSEGIEIAAKYIHSKWGSEENFPFYLDAIKNSSNKKDSSLPKFFLLLKDEEVVGCYGLIVNDFISRHDLMPWFCSLYIEESERGQRLSNFLFEHASKELDDSSYKYMYLTTSHRNFYEKFGWERLEDGYGISGNRTRIYRMPLCSSSSLTRPSS